MYYKYFIIIIIMKKKKKKKKKPIGFMYLDLYIQNRNNYIFRFTEFYLTYIYINIEGIIFKMTQLE